MAFLEWKDTYSVGLSDIDQQHKKLVAIINQLHDAMKMGGKLTDLAVVIEQLASYTRFHFDHEEQLMARAGYGELAQHKHVHAAMIGQVEAYRAGVADGQTSVSLKLMDFLKSWLFKHILETDMRYKDLLTGHRAAQQDAEKRIEWIAP